ncbi:Auxin-induced protein 15A [Glycine max]|uniref:Auxin-induced protein 15A n=1 Tax=Glycine soja TaxID=3848 RepID=A0A445ILN8_GLYSO|nr:Auxin-induced protein 15A [Glycine max]RZB86952.1 Auxin-induced protein 15A [Glycine soja]
MGFRLPGIRKTPKAVDSPKGYLVVYVREKIKQVVIPVSYLNQSSFQDLLSQAKSLDMIITRVASQFLAVMMSSNI